MKIGIDDTTISARIYFKRYNTSGEYQVEEFQYRVKPVDSFIMNKIFKMTEEKGWFVSLPEQPAAGKLQYYFEITDDTGRSVYFENEPIVIRYKGGVPALHPHTPHIFHVLAMLISTLAGLMALGKHKSYKKYGVVTLVLLLIGEWCSDRSSSYMPSEIFGPFLSMGSYRQ
ncbi:MAG: hypothetical protein R2727_05155 [Bacteroidales bacterium]